MALKLSIDTKYGFTADYHRIAEVCFYRDGRVVVQTECYSDSESRESGLLPVPGETRRMYLDEAAVAAQLAKGVDLCAAVYTVMKALPEWADATDILEEGQSAVK